MVLEEGQLAPSPLVRMFREHYKPPPTTRSGAESQPLNDFAVLWGLQEAYSAMLLVVNSCRSPSIWQQLRGSCANPLGHQKLYEPVVPHLFFIYWLWKITYIWRGFASAIRSNYHLPQSASEENICCLHTHTHTHTAVSATEVSLLPVIVCGMPCRHISGRARTADVIVLLLLLLLHHTLLYTHLTALFLGLPRWAGVRKVKPIWILLKQETVSGSGISWAICKSATRSRQITPPAPHHSVFYRPDALPATQPTVSKHRRLYYTTHVVIIMTLSQKWCRGSEHSQYKK